MTTSTPALHDATPSVEHRIGTLYDAHHARLYRLARRLSRNAEDARDLLQETFLRAARADRSIPVGAELAWLVRVLVNVRRDEWRKTARRQRLDPVAVPEPPADTTDAESALVARSVVWNALDRLAPRRRAILILHELEGEAIPAIAQLLGVTGVTVRWHLMKGRRELADIIRLGHGANHDRR